MATYSSILAWRIRMDRGAWWATVPWGCKESDMTEQQQRQWTIDRQAPLSMRILQARILQWVAMLSTRGSSNPGIEPRYPTLQVDLSHPGNPRILEWVAYPFSRGTS